MISRTDSGCKGTTFFAYMQIKIRKFENSKISNLGKASNDRLKPYGRFIFLVESQKVEWLDSQISGSSAGKVARHPDNAGKVAQMPIFSRQIQNPAAKMRPKCTMSYGHYSV